MKTLENDSPPVSQKAHSSLFGAHGIWAPGVRLMRNIRFLTKAVLISLVFLIPVAVLSFAQFTKYLQDGAFTSKERDGVVHMRLYVPVMQGILKARNATRASLGGFTGSADYAAARKEVDAALGNMRDFLKKNGDQLQLAEPLDTLVSAWQKTADVPNGVGPDGRTVFGAVTEASIRVLNDIADNSNITLDPEVGSFYLGSALVLEMPVLAEDLGQLWGWSTYFAGKGEISVKDARRYVVWEASVTRQIKTIRDYLGRYGNAEPASLAKLNMSVLDKVEAYKKKVADHDKILADGGGKDALFSQGQAALIELTKLYETGLNELDALLIAREQKALATELWLIATLGALILFGLYLFFCFYLVTNGGINLIRKHLQEMASGDLRRAPVKPWGRDEPAEVIADLRVAYDALHQLIRRVRHSARDLTGTSGEIARASLDLSQRTESAAAALEQQAATMEEIGSSVNAMADNSKDASVLARENASVAQKGGEVIRNVVSVMSAINSSSQKIGDIISTIDSIAFQTNILALNAAVEAARAGEQGRGFAVVASEVRVLAQRSAAAAKEIKDLISESVKNVEQGTSVVSGAGQTMDEILANANRIDELLGEIAVSSREQSNGVGQSVSAIQLLEQSTQQNAALVEETSAAAGALSDQSDGLMREIANFRVA